MFDSVFGRMEVEYTVEFNKIPSKKKRQDIPDDDEAEGKIRIVHNRNKIIIDKIFKVRSLTESARNAVIIKCHTQLSSLEVQMKDKPCFILARNVILRRLRTLRNVFIHQPLEKLK